MAKGKARKLILFGFIFLILPLYSGYIPALKISSQQALRYHFHPEFPDEESFSKDSPRSLIIHVQVCITPRYT